MATIFSESFLYKKRQHQCSFFVKQTFTMFLKITLLFLALAATLTAENNPTLQVQTCTSSGSFTTQSSSITFDSNWCWTHQVSSSTNCYTGNTWNSSICPDPITCATNCALDGDALTLKFVTQGSSSTNIGSRVYLLDSTVSKY